MKNQNKKNKQIKVKEHNHWGLMLLGLCIVGLICFALNDFSGRLSDIETEFNSGEWECIKYEEVTYRQCESLRDLWLLLEEDSKYKICEDNHWHYDCGMGGIYIWISDESEKQREIRNEKCKEETIYYGDCIKWQRVKIPSRINQNV